MSDINLYLEVLNISPEIYDSLVDGQLSNHLDAYKLKRESCLRYIDLFRGSNDAEADYHTEEVIDIDNKIDALEKLIALESNS